MRTIYVLLFSPETRFLLFEGSHHKIVREKKVADEFGLLTLPHDALKIEGIMHVQHYIAQGGFAFIDGRVGWTILGGELIAIGYASPAEIAHWGWIEVGDTAPLRDKVAELNRRGLMTKIKFVKRESAAPNA